VSEQVHGEHEAEPQILRGLRLAVGLSVVILIIESFGAFLSRSLSLTVDAAHNLPDILAFAVSWAALRATERGASSAYTFGSHRLEVFASLFNAGIVLAVGIGFGFAALQSLRSGAPFAGAVDSTWILAAAVPTLLLRATNLFVLQRLPARARDLNLRSVIVHLASDVVITGALLVAGVTLLLDSSVWWVDPAAAIFIGAVLTYESIPLFRGGWEVLTERTPQNLSVDLVTKAALTIPAVSELHDIHLWAVCPTLICMSAHVRIRDMTVRESMIVVTQLRKRMEEEFGILHSVFEVEATPVR
jgi:cobalt-zinc-cadmium efflux system protein